MLRYSRALIVKICSGIWTFIVQGGSEYVLLFRGSECFIVQGFRMLYSSGVQNVVLFNGSECCIGYGFRMLYSSGVQNDLLCRGPGWTAFTCETELKKGEYLNLAKLILTISDPSANIVCLAARHIR